MFRRLFGSGRNDRPPATVALYEEIVAAARQPHFYAVWNVPDTPLGRYEMLSLHMFLFLHRLRGEAVAAQLGEDVAEEFFRDIDHSLRELGIGDMGIPKRVRKLARMFYGRATSYGEAVDRGDREALTAALRRNVMPERAVWPEADDLAGYVFHACAALAAQPVESFFAGELRFPLPSSALAGEAA